MGSTRGLLCLLLAGALQACAQAGCRAGLAPMRGLTLYFGGSIPEAAWQDFARATLTPAFPDGFTTTLATGQWRNPATGQIVQETTRVVEIDGIDPFARATPVISIYRSRFNQVSVGMAERPVCAAF